MKTVKLMVKEDFDFFHDGITKSEYKSGHEVEFSEADAAIAIKQKWAVDVKEKSSGRKTTKAADETKAATEKK